MKSKARNYYFAIIRLRYDKNRRNYGCIIYSTIVQKTHKLFIQSLNAIGFYLRGRSLHPATRKSSRVTVGRPLPLQKYGRLIISIAKRYQSSIFSLLISLRHDSRSRFIGFCAPTLRFLLVRNIEEICHLLDTVKY